MRFRDPLAGSFEGAFRPSERESPGQINALARTYIPAMTKLTKATLTKKIQERTGLSRRRAQRGIAGALTAIKSALQAGRQVEVPGIGRLKTTDRRPKRVIRENLRGSYRSSVVELHEKHPRSVRLFGAKDLSEDPQPTIVHPKEKAPSAPPRPRSIAIAFPSWRRHQRFR
jgi:nucleoid DNA-binding protein